MWWSPPPSHISHTHLTPAPPLLVQLLSHAAMVAGTGRHTTWFFGGAMTIAPELFQAIRLLFVTLGVVAKVR